MFQINGNLDVGDPFPHICHWVHGSLTFWQGEWCQGVIWRCHNTLSLLLGWSPGHCVLPGDHSVCGHPWNHPRGVHQVDQHHPVDPAPSGRSEPSAKSGRSAVSTILNFHSHFHHKEGGGWKQPKKMTITIKRGFAWWLIMTSVWSLFRPGGGQDALTETADLSKRRNITTPDTLMDLVR